MDPYRVAAQAAKERGMLMMLYGILGAVVSGVAVVALAAAILAILHWRKAANDTMNVVFYGAFVLFIILVQVGFVGGAIEGWRRTDWSKSSPVPVTESSEAK